jgi:hypothetical protein
VSAEGDLGKMGERAAESNWVQALLQAGPYQIHHPDDDRSAHRFHHYSHHPKLV